MKEGIKNNFEEVQQGIQESNREEESSLGHQYQDEERRDLSEVRKQLKKGREIKDLINAFKVFGGGSKGIKLEQIQENLSMIATNLESKNREWLEKKFLEFRDYFQETKITEQKIREYYRKGLETLLTQTFRLYNKEEPTSLSLLENDIFIEDLISAYTYDFIISLRRSEQFQAFPAQALKIAQLSNRLRPNTLFRLEKKFPEFGKSVIQHAAVHNPSNPEGFLRKIQEVIPELEKKFLNFGKSVIQRIAVHNPSNPEGFLRKIQEIILELEKKFLNFGKSVIQHAAVYHPSNPEGFLRKIQEVISELENKFPNFGKSVIQHAAVNNPSNPEEFLRKIQEIILELEKKFLNFGKSVIQYAAVKNPSNPEEFLRKIQEVIPELEKKFPNFGKSVIQYAAVNNPSNPEGFLRKAQEVIPELENKFPNFGKLVIQYAAVKNPSNPEEYIRSIIEK